MLSFDDVVASVDGRADLRLVGVDGLPLAGKSTLADRLAAATDGVCVHLDDFVKPQAEWRWHDRPSFPFDYIRYDEFLGAVASLAARGFCRYLPYNFETGRIAEAERVVRADRPVIVEGVSALHPDLAPLYALRVWVESDASTVLAASLARGVGAWAREWEVMFIPSVALYLRTDPKRRAEIVAAGRGFGFDAARLPPNWCIR